MLRGENLGIAVLMNVVPPTLFAEAIPDGIVVTRRGRSVQLRSVWAGEGFPADVHRVLGRLDAQEGGPTPIITVRRMSPGAIELLAERGLSWADADGHADITASGFYIARLKPKPLPRRETTTITWSPSAEVVAEYVLSRQLQLPMGLAGIWNGVDRVAMIADATNISPSQIAKVLVMFDEEGYTAKLGPERGPTATRQFREQGRLLSDWAGHYKRAVRKERRAELHVLSRDPLDWSMLVAEKLAAMPWAVSGWVAADVIAPFTTHLPDMILYVPEQDFDNAYERLTADTEVSPVERGGRIHLRSAGKHVFDFTSTTAGRPVASPVRVYADLLRVGGRAADTAEHLREVAIGF